MKIYLAGSIAGGRDYEEGLFAVYNTLIELGHEVLTPFVVDQEINNARFPDLSGDERATAIFDEDLHLLDIAEAAIAEVSQPSSGTGTELGVLVGYARFLGIHKPTLALKHEDLKDKRFSFLVQGNPHLELQHYSLDTVKDIVCEFMERIDIEGRVVRERE